MGEMIEKRSMAELKNIMGIPTSKNEIKNMNDLQWESMYNTDMIKLEKYTPFEEQIKNPPYRFNWVLKKIDDNLEKGNSLDVGCNNGVLTHLLSCKGYTAHGVDVGDKLIENCIRNVPNGKFIKAHADKDIPFSSNFFQLITALEVLEHVKYPSKMVQEMLRVLTPGGTLLVTVPVGKAYDCPHHLRYFTFYSLGKLFEPYTDNFKICKIFKTHKNEKRELFGIEVIK